MDSKKKKKKAKKKVQSAEKPAEKNGAFDFGGIPDRDLKKNLGCG